PGHRGLRDLPADLVGTVETVALAEAQVAAEAVHVAREPAQGREARHEEAEARGPRVPHVRSSAAAACPSSSAGGSTACAAIARAPSGARGHAAPHPADGRRATPHAA